MVFSWDWFPSLGKQFSIEFSYHLCLLLGKQFSGEFSCDLFPLLGNTSAVNFYLTLSAHLANNSVGFLRWLHPLTWQTIQRWIFLWPHPLSSQSVILFHFHPDSCKICIWAMSIWDGQIVCHIACHEWCCELYIEHSYLFLSCDVELERFVTANQFNFSQIHWAR